MLPPADRTLRYADRGRPLHSDDRPRRSGKPPAACGPGAAGARIELSRRPLAEPAPLLCRGLDL
ncbi:hypothetical protein Pla175_51830 [Pirellulimonas nuda]|uniref:Uncharacterized protein n=1 Tax=Pirellulimonas nuda TaxID=2528009 RepID=A0A518DJY2_9BACT|nr:hypothetical protein [Pirellulimonas nuda]QDU91752.1 hypothetical protein Pla175_51830 [Pirellulimonas nuda]